MRLINDWKRKFPRLWSVRLALLAAAASACEAGFNLYLSGKPPVLACIATVLALATAVARIVAQPAVGEE